MFAVLTGLSQVALSEGPYYMGAGDGGPLYDSDGGCVVASNAMESAAPCGKDEPMEEAAKPEPEVITRVIVDCTKCPPKQ
ncbi:MAG: hypothetical protein R3E95_10540 [Thiolinea sp.]